MKVMRFLFGLAIGAGAALLLAPKSGRELRQQLAGGASGDIRLVVREGGVEVEVVGAVHMEGAAGQAAAGGGGARLLPTNDLIEPLISVILLNTNLMIIISLNLKINMI